MNKRKNNLGKENYKYLASGSFKDVFIRQPGFKPASKRHGKRYSEGKSYVSAFFFDRKDAETEVKAYENMYLIDPLEIFTIHLVEKRDLLKEPNSVWYFLQEHLKSQLPKEWKGEKLFREFPYVFEIVLPYGGISYEDELKGRSNCSLRDFLFPILFLIFCVGYMNDKGYFHKDIRDANILFDDSQLFLIDYSNLTKDCKTDLNDIFFIFDEEAEKEEPREDCIHLNLFWPPEKNYLYLLEVMGFSKNIKNLPNKYKHVDLTLKYLLQFLKKKDPKIVKEHVYYLKQLKNLQRFFPERHTLDHEYREILFKRMIVRNDIFLKCYEKHKDSNGQLICNQAVRDCLEPAMYTHQDIFLLYADRYDSYQLGSTILIWIRTFREKFYHILIKEDKHIFDSFSLSVYEHLCAFNVIYRMNSFDFHKYFLEQIRFLGYNDFLKEYKNYCSKINNLENDTANLNSFQVKESVESEKKYFKNLFSYLDLLME